MKWDPKMFYIKPKYYNILEIEVVETNWYKFGELSLDNGFSFIVLKIEF